LSGEFVEDFSGAVGLLGRDEDIHLTEGAYVHRHDGTDGFLRQDDGDLLRLEDSAKDLGLCPANVPDDRHRRLP
jgi:hypothetical protein